MRNFVNFHPTTQKFQNFTSVVYFCPKYMRFELKKIRRSYLLWHWAVMQNLNKPWLCGFKNGMRNWWAHFVQKIYVSVRKFQRDYVSWHWRVMQNLKENQLKKKTQGIWLTFVRAGKSLKICTLTGSFCPIHVKI